MKKPSAFAAELRAIAADMEAKGLKYLPVAKQQWVINGSLAVIASIKADITELRRLRFETGDNYAFDQLIEYRQKHLTNSRLLHDYFMQQIEDSTPQVNTQDMIDALFQKVSRRKLRKKGKR